MKIGLAIEDNEIIGRVLKGYLSGKYRLNIAETGELGIRKANKKKYGFILLDLGLPGLHGKKIIPHIKSSSLNKDTPILVYTAHDSNEEMKKEYKSMGVNEILTKPLNPFILIEKIEACLNEKISE